MSKNDKNAFVTEVNFSNNLPLWGIQVSCRKNGNTIASLNIQLIINFKHNTTIFISHIYF